jgi:predicted CXXCH cytochrome family protein
MRWLVTGIIAGALLVLAVIGMAGAGTVSADNGPHVAGHGVVADSCAACHRAHTGQAEELLTQAQTSLCYSCHGNGATGADTDVEDGQWTGGAGGALRAGGFSNSRIKAEDPVANQIAASTPEAVSSQHGDDSPSVMWGNGTFGSGIGGTLTLQCGSCHDPHGNGKYRILKPKPGGQGTTDVSVAQATPTISYTTTNYLNVSYVDQGEISEWCSQCHTRYEAASAGLSDGSETIFKYRHESDGAGATGGTGDPYNDGTASCVRCHAAHGTNAVTYLVPTDTPGPTVTPGGPTVTPTPQGDAGFSAAVAWPGGTPASGENRRLLKMDNRGICQKCHNK